jgi:hypothetical protein
LFRYHAAAKYVLPAFAASLAVAATPLAAQRNNGTGTRDGAAVSGVDQAHHIDFVGDCPSLTVNGVGNQISITLRPGAPLTVSGVDNVVTWRIAGKGRPKLAVSGVDNQVRPGR